MSSAMKKCPDKRGGLSSGR